MDYSAEGAVFRKLKDTITRLKNQREEVVAELQNDRGDLQTVENGMAQLTRELEGRMAIIKEKERKLGELEKAINQTEKSYDIIVETTQKLSSALEQQSSHLRGRIRK